MRTPHRTRRRALAGLAAGVLVITACGSDDDTAEDVAESVDDAAEDVGDEVEETVGDGEETDGEGEGDSDGESSDTVVDVAAGNEDFSTLVAAIQAAGLEETLRGEGPFTVFAPTDEGFDALPGGVLDALLLPENQQALTDILLFHVVPSEVPSADVAAGEVTTALGENAEITIEGDEIRIAGATIVLTDITADNGIVHVIDAVMIPPTIDPADLTASAGGEGDEGGEGEESEED